MYHNPVCSKSRGALQIIGDRGIDADVVEYMKVHPTRADLERIVKAISDEPAALQFRHASPRFLFPAEV